MKHRLEWLPSTAWSSAPRALRSQGGTSTRSEATPYYSGKHTQQRMLTLFAQHMAVCCQMWYVQSTSLPLEPSDPHLAISSLIWSVALKQFKARSCKLPTSPQCKRQMISQPVIKTHGYTDLSWRVRPQCTELCIFKDAIMVFSSLQFHVGSRSGTPESSFWWWAPSLFPLWYHMTFFVPKEEWNSTWLETQRLQQSTDSRMNQRINPPKVAVYEACHTIMSSVLQAVTVHHTRSKNFRVCFDYM